MKSKKGLYTVLLSVVIIVIGLMGSLFLEREIADRVTSVVTSCTAVVGAVALFYQFKRDKNLNEANFLVEYSNQFYSTYHCADLMNELEKCRVDENYTLDVDAYCQDIVGYLEWLETLASLINAEVLQISKIDNVMSYRYFVIVNNKQVQEGELTRNREFYRSIYDVYSAWVAYKKKNNLPIIFEENDLSETIGYQEIISKNKSIR